MKDHRSILKVALAAVLVLSVASACAPAAQRKAMSEEEIGIRHVALTDEAREMPAHGEYGSAQPGTSVPLSRAFENSPPLIPHDLTGMLPIAETNNACLGCHMPEHATGLNATPLPRSHFFDIDTGKDLGGELDGKRYPCMQCHVPQVDIPEPIRNTFEADFRSADMKTRSNLLDNLNEGVKAE